VTRQKRKRRPKLMGRKTALLVATAGIAAGGFLGGFFSVANPAGHLSVTSGGPAGCVVYVVYKVSA
jgi:hypothetical protein